MKDTLDGLRTLGWGARSFESEMSNASVIHSNIQGFVTHRALYQVSEMVNKPQSLTIIEFTPWQFLKE